MTTTTAAPTQQVEAALPSVKRRRNPMLIAASILLVVLGALVGVWLWSTSSSTTPVLATSSAIVRGHTITDADLKTVYITTDPGLSPVPASSRASLVGQKALSDIPAGTLVTRDAVGRQVVPASGDAVVGLDLSSSQMPASQLLPGDRVRVVTTPGEGGDVPDDPTTIAASVVSVSRSTDALEDGQAVSPVTSTVVDVRVKAADAPRLAALAASGRIALVLDSREG